jgi:hypothetical protein
MCMSNRQTQEMWSSYKYKWVTATLLVLIIHDDNDPFIKDINTQHVNTMRHTTQWLHWLGRQGSVVFIDDYVSNRSVFRYFSTNGAFTKHLDLDWPWEQTFGFQSDNNVVCLFDILRLLSLTQPMTSSALVQSSSANPRSLAIASHVNRTRILKGVTASTTGRLSCSSLLPPNHQACDLSNLHSHLGPNKIPCYCQVRVFLLYIFLSPLLLTLYTLVPHLDLER